MFLLRIIKIAFFAILFTFATTTNLHADCEDRPFNLKVSSQVSLQEILDQFSDMCNFSVVSKDQNATAMLLNNVSGVNIKNLKLNQIFDLLLSERNINYEFDKNILKISSLSTKTFKIDYITSIREGTAITKASVDSAPVEVGEKTQNESSSGEQSDNSIKTTEKFDFWSQLKDEIKAILNNGPESIKSPDPIINQSAGLVTVTGTNSQIKRVEDYLQTMQKRLQKQVMIDVNIIAVDLENSYTKGVDWRKFDIGLNSFLGNNPNTPSGYTWGNRNPRQDITKFPKFDEKTGKPTEPGEWRWGETPGTKSTQSRGFWKIGANINFNLDGVVNFLETRGKTKVISSPKVVTLNNQQALITVGDTINYRVKEESTNDTSLSGRTDTTYTQYSVFIGILLNLLPEISDDNEIMLRINPSLSTFKYEDDNTRQLAIREIAPDTLQKKLSTVVRVRSGETVIIGGLIGQTKGKDNTKVPFLGDLPFVGNLFSSTGDKVTSTELIFVVTPRVVESGKVVEDSLGELGFSKSLYEY